jgi:hypothetical protein
MDINFMHKSKSSRVSNIPTSQDMVRFTTYEHVGHTQEIQKSAPIIGPPGAFIPLNAARSIPVNARVRVKTHTYAVEGAAQTHNGKVFYSLRS